MNNAIINLIIYDLLLYMCILSVISRSMIGKLVKNQLLVYLETKLSSNIS